MMAKSSSSFYAAHRYYLVGIVPPQSLSSIIRDLKESLRPFFKILAPLPPLWPFIVSTHPPKIPVLGLLPPADEPIRMKDFVPSGIDVCRILQKKEGGRASPLWLVWRIESGNWVTGLQKALTDQKTRVGLQEMEGQHLKQERVFFPLLTGIPLALWSPRVSSAETYGTDSIGGRFPNLPSPPELSSGWRALNLLCWEIEYTPQNPWYLALAWRVLWRRRLKRAPKMIAGYPSCP